MSRIFDQAYLLAEQYRDATNFNARIQLHVRFSTNKYGWLRWVFDQLNLPEQCRILELGTGPGNLWRDNANRIPAGWDITLSDFSAGMAQQAQRNLENGQRRFRFEVIDAQSIPFDDASFDAVIANHMLYHVPDKPRAFSEMRRVLKPRGRLYTSTIGKAHLQELYELARRFDPEFVFWGRQPTETFILENGLAQLSRWFTNITLHRYDDSLFVTESVPLIDYVSSGIRMSEDKRVAFTKFVEQEMKTQGGVIFITKDSGMFVSHRGSNS